MADLAPALPSEPRRSVPLCEGVTATCLQGRQEPALLQAGSLHGGDLRESPGVQGVSFTKCSGLDPLSLWLGWAARMCPQGTHSWWWVSLYGERRVLSGFTVLCSCLLTGC